MISALCSVRFVLSKCSNHKLLYVLYIHFVRYHATTIPSLNTKAPPFTNLRINRQRRFSTLGRLLWVPANSILGIYSKYSAENPQRDCSAFGFTKVTVLIIWAHHNSKHQYLAPQCLLWVTMTPPRQWGMSNNNVTLLLLNQHFCYKVSWRIYLTRQHVMLLPRAVTVKIQAFVATIPDHPHESESVVRWK